MIIPKKRYIILETSSFLCYHSDMRKQPLYESVYHDIIDRIKTGKIQPGDRLPGEYELMAQYNVSRTTIRRTMKLLEGCNLIYRVKKSGTYLNGKPQHSGAAKIIPLVIPGGEPAYASAAQAVSLLNNCFVPVYTSQNLPTLERKHLESLLNTNIDALVIYPCSSQRNMDLLSGFLNRQIPVVFLDRGYLGFNCPLVTSDNKWGMSKIVERLIELGHRKIAYFAIDEFMYTSEEERFSGYCQTLIKHNIPLRNEYIFWTNNMHQKASSTEQLDAFTRAYRQTVRDFLEMKEPPTAVCCCNDYSARALITAFGESGIRCPEDISVTGFDDSDVATSEYPQITTVAQSFRTMGERAMEVALELCDDKPVRQIHYVSTKIISRDSMRAIEE